MASKTKVGIGTSDIVHTVPRVMCFSAPITLDTIRPYRCMLCHCLIWIFSIGLVRERKENIFRGLHMFSRSAANQHSPKLNTLNNPIPAHKIYDHKPCISKPSILSLWAGTEHGDGHPHAWAMGALPWQSEKIIQYHFVNVFMQPCAFVFRGLAPPGPLVLGTICWMSSCRQMNEEYTAQLQWCMQEEWPSITMLTY